MKSVNAEWDLEKNTTTLSTLDAFVGVYAAYLSAPVLSVESETCLGLSEKEGGLKKGEISKGEKWLSSSCMCFYYIAAAATAIC